MKALTNKKKKMKIEEIQSSVKEILSKEYPFTEKKASRRIIQGAWQKQGLFFKKSIF